MKKLELKDKEKGLQLIERLVAKRMRGVKVKTFRPVLYSQIKPVPLTLKGVVLPP